MQDSTSAQRLMRVTSCALENIISKWYGALKRGINARPTDPSVVVFTNPLKAIHFFLGGTQTKNQ
jgi:hypothetical protein